MRLLVVFAHPSTESFGAAIFRAATEALGRAGHELRIRDLYREGFDPVLRPEHWTCYLSEPERNVARVADHVADLKWAEGLVVIYPTWFYGPPAILKGWLERVFLPGVSFEIPASPRARAKGKLQNIRLFVGITTSGSPWWWLRLIRDPGRSLFTRGLRVLFHPRARMLWRQLHAMNHQTDAGRRAFLARIARDLEAIA
jgi:NAD(P)H dehydrogenase (quinone)